MQPTFRDRIEARSTLANSTCDSVPARCIVEFLSLQPGESAMSWRVQYLETQKIVEATYWGETSAADLRDSTVEAVALVKEHEATLGLVDCLEQTKTGSVVDLFDLPELYDHEKLSRKVRIAFVEPTDPELKELAEFYETVCVNRGWQIHTFRTRVDALNWLLSRTQ